ncbi:hypothetical protein JTB14_020902 [Gonioctena quinquepunctata]|nr:hypothetical protein JTB14_020902 [Gonioctena quinquepunctata]
MFQHGLQKNAWSRRLEDRQEVSGRTNDRSRRLRAADNNEEDNRHKNHQSRGPQGIHNTPGSPPIPSTQADQNVLRGVVGKNSQGLESITNRIHKLEQIVDIPKIIPALDYLNQGVENSSNEQENMLAFLNYFQGGDNALRCP